MDKQVYTKDQLLQLIDASKLFKSRVIVTVPGNPGTVIGTDDTISYLKMAPYVSQYSNIWNVNKDPLIFTNSIPVILESMNSGSLIDNTISIPDNLYSNLFYQKIINGFRFFLQSERLPFTHYSNIHTNSEFMRIVSLSASQGSTDWIIDKDRHYMISLYSGLVNVNKSDQVDLFIHDTSDCTLMAKFVVDKGKKGKISIYMHTIRF